MGVDQERRAWFALAALSLGFFLTLLDQSLVAIALPSIMADFSASTAQGLWVSSAFLLAVVVPLLVTGRLGDILGQRRVFIAGLVLFLLGALGAALAPSIEFLIAARAVQGLGASLQMPQPMAVINRVFARGRRGFALGVWGVVGSLASLTGPLVGGTVVEIFGWSGVFWIHVPIVVLAIILALRWIPSLPTVARTVDFSSVAVAFIAVAGVVSGLQLGPVVGWGLGVWTMIFGGLAAGAGFIALQARAARTGREAVVPLEVFGTVNFSVGVVSISSMGFMAATMMIPVMIWLQAGLGVDSALSGILVTPMPVVALIVTPWAGSLADRLSARRLQQLGFSVVIAGFIGLWWLINSSAGLAGEPGTEPSSSLLGLVALTMAVIGFGQSFIWGPNAAASLRDVPEHLMGAASGVYNTSRQIGSVVGVAVVSLVMQLAGTDMIVASAAAVWPIIAALAAGVIAASFFRDTHEAPQRAPDGATG